MATRVSTSSQSTIEGFPFEDVRDGRMTSLGREDEIKFARRRSSSSTSESSSSSEGTPSTTIAEANISLSHEVNAEVKTLFSNLKIFFFRGTNQFHFRRKYLRKLEISRALSI